MESPGDFYTMALHDDRLRAGLIALDRESRTRRSAPIRKARSALADALRALAAVVDVPRPTAAVDRPLAAVGT